MDEKNWEDIDTDNICMMGQQFKRKEKQDIEEILEFGKEILEKRGGVQAQILFEKEVDDGVIINSAILFFDNEKEKNKILKIIRKIAQTFGAEKAFFLTEGYMSQVPKDGKLPYIRPSRSIKRKDCLVVSEFTRDLKTSKNVTLIFRKEGDEIIYEDKIEGDDVESIWNPFIELEGLKERNVKHIKEMDEKFLETQAKKFHKKYAPKLEKAETEKERREILVEMIKEMKNIKSDIEKQMYEEVDKE